jgi:hypothetical protein
MTGLSARATNYAAFDFTPFAPPIKDLGRVAKEQKQVVWLWNGSKTAPLVITGVGHDSEADGITWDIVPPVTIAAMTSVRVVITIGITGPLVFDAFLVFESACGFDPTLELVGTRAATINTDVGFLFSSHDWSDGLKESFSWLSDVLVAWDRTEQRIELRNHPRHSVQFKWIVSGNERRVAENIITGRRERLLLIPVPQDVQTLATALPPGMDTIPVNTLDRDFVVEGVFAIWDAYNHYELRTIFAIADDYLVLNQALTEGWPAGTFVAPCRYYMVTESRKIRRLTSDVAALEITAVPMDETRRPPRETPEYYRSDFVCPYSANWSEDEEGVDYAWTLLDNDTGIISVMARSDEPVLSRSASFLIDGREAVDDFFFFLSDLSGRVKPFWLPTLAVDVKIIGEAAIGAQIIVIQQMGYEVFSYENPARMDLEFVARDGTVFRAHITGVMATIEGHEQLTLDTPLPFAISEATVERSAWLELVRLDSDTVEINWFSPTAIEVKVTVVALP